MMQISLAILNVSIVTIDRVLRRNEMRMKQLYNVPFERNSERVKETRHQYVQVKLECAFYAYSTVQHLYTGARGQGTTIYIDEAGFNLAKGRRHGRNRIGQRAMIDVPGQRGGNVK
ncbi:hypothetical protein N1851_032666 [Merluccius polli]|uniref:Uncharacterized protein n=1 Tax=Merluccius polli TaxID=89951 RepID=A0AA47NPA3_MERPO|nr:hypothetical protein N1851_032666 [Merluccius polli]